MKQQLTKRWERIMSLALAACLGIGLLTPGALAVNGSDMVLIEGDPALTEDSDYRANTYIQTSNPSAYANLSTEEALALAALNGDQGFKSFPVTMFNYEGSQTQNNNYTDSTGAFNDAQRQADVETQGTGLTEWQALYFSGGNPSPYSFTYDGFTSEAGYYPAENITYQQLLDSQNTYYILQNGKYVPVTAESVSKTDYPPLDEQPKVTEGFPYGNQSYYMEYQGSYYRITGSEWHRIDTNWGYYEIKGILDEATTLELGPMDAAAQVGVSVADIPVTSVDAGQPAPAEPDVTTGPVETTEPSETTDPAETTEPSETADPAETTEPSETTEPVETTEPTQPAQPPEELPEAPSDAGALLAGEVVIARTEEGYYWLFGEQKHTIQGTVLEKKTLYSVTLRAGETEIFKGDVNSLDEVFNGERLYEHREAGTPVPDGTTGSLPYANYNFWTGTTEMFGGDYRKYVYNGLMEKELDSEGNPVFTVPDAGIFTEEHVNGKTVQKANFPFIYDSTTGYYEFNAAEESVYFHNGELHYDDEPQKVNNDGWKTAFLPFNDSYGENANKIQNPDYHFGMRADIEFSMTDDGKWMEREIQFEFAGDDDMWVFVDGVLVLDLGGIHDSANGVINFATGEVTRSATNLGSFSFGILGEDITKDNIYTKDGKEGQLGKNFETFAAENRHTLTIFYLERGAGESNCRIKFNLPQPDSLTVEKEIPTTDSEGQQIDQETMDALNEQEFQFVLMDNGQPVSEQLYLKTTVNKKLEVGKTGRDGTFTLRNGEKVKFLTMEYDNNHTYTVVEEVTADSRFESVVWSRDIDPVGTVVNGEQSNTFTVAGKEEIAESVTLTAKNTYKHVNKTTMQAMPDRVVVDFGLPVVIGVLANDTAANGNKELVNVTVDPEFNAYGTAETTSDGKVKFTLAKPLDQVITLTYTAKAQGATSADVDTDTATVTIIPATQMYYEQDFNDLVSYDGANGIEWKVDETAKDATQEGNVVEGKSPYGADTFYANATGDSAGGVASVDTTNGWASFTYDFTGTGTAILARLESNTGYIYVTVKNKNSDGTADYRLYRDTRVAGSEIGNTTELYNIPVYQITGLDYGTYTVEVRIAKPLQGVGKYRAGNMFYLDGIRVYDPLNPNELGEVAETAYRDDNERYNKVVSLRDKLINDYASVVDGELKWNENMGNFVTLTDTNGNLTTAEEYKDIGPKEELYLDEEQSVTFDLVNWDPNTGGKLYLGMKSLTGTGSVRVGNKEITLNNTFDQYYDISKYNNGLFNGRYTFTITVTEGPVSLTNIKVTGDAEFVITENPDVSFD